MKILVGLSGGVDSAVAAYLLKEQGHDVTCAFMRNWDSMTNNDIMGNPTLDDEICSQEKDYNDALSVAKQLGLELLRIDFIKEYWDNVFTIFLKEYEAGRTPNPDILCNKYIKFDSFMEFAKEKGFDYVATGHYARTIKDKGHNLLAKALDTNKDQTYFLCQISRYALDKAVFPLGDIDKTRVREIAAKLNLSIANKKDSTGICFIGERNFRQFLSNYLPMKPGNIIDIDTKEVVGKHSGVIYYTLGQRKGLNIGGKGGPWFVVDKDIYKNELYVASGLDSKWLMSTECLVRDLNWLYDFDTPIECYAKFRYRQPDQKITLIKEKDYVRCIFDQELKAITPGQEAVFYKDDIVLGGGVIDRVYKDKEDLFEKIKNKINDK